MKEKDGETWLYRDDLIELLRAIPKNYRISVNQMGNLMLLSDDFKYEGYIDFYDGSVAIVPAEERL